MCRKFLIFYITFGDLLRPFQFFHELQIVDNLTLLLKKFEFELLKELLEGKGGDSYETFCI